MKMMLEKEDLGLSLSLSIPDNWNSGNHHHHHHQNNINNSTSSSSLQLNMMMMQQQQQQQQQPCPSASSPFSLFHKSSLPETFASSDRSRIITGVGGGEGKTYLKGIDVNRAPAGAVDSEEEEEAGVSSPNSTLSSVSGKRSEREPHGEDHELERASSRGISDEEDGENCRKKLRLSKDQAAILEESFKEHNTLNPKQKMALAKRLGLRPRQVEVWFQNRRARTKLKQTEVDCEFLKRCCENLTEENRRLQKEVQELRALKLSPQFYMQMTPPTTLTMCPSCERVGTPPVTDPRLNQMAPMQTRPVPFNLWTGAPSTVNRTRP